MTREQVMRSWWSWPDAPSTEHSNHDAHLPRQGAASQGPPAKPRKAEGSLDSVTHSIQVLSKQLYFLDHCLYTDDHIAMFWVQECMLFKCWQMEIHCTKVI